MVTQDDIIQYCESGNLRWTNHIVERLFQRGIAMDDIVNTLIHGKIIEEYPNDYPYPSCLVLGLSPVGKHLHIVCGMSENALWLITAYYPKPDEWSGDFSVRKEQAK